MTIASRTTAETLVGDGSNRKFSFTFRAWEGEIRVVITDPDDKATDVTAKSSIAMAANNLGGIVTYPAATGNPALTAGWKLTIMRDMNFLQEVGLVNATRWNPEVIEQEFDRLTAMCQQLHEMADRALSVVAGAEVSAAELLEDICNIEQRIREIAGQTENTALQVAANAEAAALSELRATISAASAKADADRAARLVDPASLASGVFNVRKAQVLAAGVAGQTVTLMGYYYPARDVLYLAYNGTVLTPIKPGVEPTGDYSYEEVGTDHNVESNQVKLHFATRDGDVLDMFVVASAAGKNIEQIEALVAQAAVSATAADVSADAAKESADKAEEAAATLPDIATASAGDTLIAEAGPGGGLVARWQPPSAGAPPQRVGTILPSPLAIGAAFTVPQYTVGGKKLTVHLDGVLCGAGADGLYLETGAAGAKSTTITLNNALDAGRELTAIVAG